MATERELKRELRLLKQQGAEKDKIAAKEKEVEARRKKNAAAYKARKKAEKQLENHIRKLLFTEDISYTFRSVISPCDHRGEGKKKYRQGQDILKSW